MKAIYVLIVLFAFMGKISSQPSENNELSNEKNIKNQTHINDTVFFQQSSNSVVSKKILTPLGNQPNDKVYNVKTNTWSAEKIEQCEQAWLYSGGLFKSTGSCTFIEMNNYLVNHTVNCMVIDGDNIYIGTDHGIYISNDYGETWLDPQINPIDNLSSCKVYALSRGTNKLFACTDDGLYILTDDEISWDQFFDNKIFTCIEFGAGNDIYIGEIYEGVYKSTDYGSSWIGTPILNYGTFCLKYNDSLLFAGTVEGSGLKKSTNEGASWIPLWSEDKVTSIYIDGSNIYIGTKEEGFWMSTDSGNYFEVKNVNYPIKSQDPLTYYQLNSLAEYNGYLYAATDNGLYRTDLSEISWSACYVKDEYFNREAELLTKMIFLNDNPSDLWIACWGGQRYPSSTMIEGRDPPFDPPNFPNYLCHSFTWHLTEDGISSVFLDGPNTMNYIPTDDKTDWEKQNWDYIQTTWDDPLWEKVTYNWGHSGIRSLKNDVNESEEENLIIESKWGNNGPLVEHKLTDCPYYSPSSIVRYWKNKKVVSGEIVDDRRIGRELITLVSNKGITTSIPADSVVEFYVAPMKNHKISLKSGFHADSGSNFHAYVKDYYEEGEQIKQCNIPWEEDPELNYIMYSNLNKNEYQSHNTELKNYSSNQINKVNRYLLPCDTPKTDPFKYSGLGAGTETDPFQITNIEQFQEMARDNYNHSWVLLNDIDASETRYWNPQVVKGDTLYYGIKTIPSKIKSLDGKGHIIKNLYKYNETVSSLFTGINCKIIKRIGFENFTRVGATIAIFRNDDNDENYLIEECFVTGNIIGKFDDGKLPIGFTFLMEPGLIRNCYSDLIISADSKVYNFGKIFYDKAVFENCHTVGIAASPKVMSPFGYSGKAIACFWDNETIIVTDSLGIGTGLPTSAMKKRATFEAAGWDFDSTWYIDEGMDYPRLQVFRHDTTSVVNSRKSFDFNLDCNPNPAENIVNLDFSVSQYCPVSITVSNSLGMKVALVINQKYYSEGSYRQAFDTSTLPSGIYFCTLQTPECTITKQFVVVR